MSTKRLRKTLLIVCGTLCVSLGTLGIFLPLLPTTPFLLLAAICYSRSSERLYHWLVTNRWFGEYIRTYREGKGIPLKQKIFTILLMWMVMGFAAWHATSQLWVSVLLLGIALAVTIHLLWMKTYRPEVKKVESRRGHPLPEDPA